MLQIQESRGGSILAGAREGRAAQERLLVQALADFLEVIELDFSGVEAATASYLREAVFGLRAALERHGVRTPLIILNANQVVEEDLALVARSLGTSIVSGSIVAQRGRVLGVLDEAQRETLSALARLGEASASELHDQVPSDPPVQVTAWNNRLAALASKGVVVEIRRGREKRFRPVLKELEYGR